MSATKLGVNPCCTDKSLTYANAPVNDTDLVCLVCGSTYEQKGTDLKLVERRPYSPFGCLLVATKP